MLWLVCCRPGRPTPAPQQQQAALHPSSSPAPLAASPTQSCSSKPGYMEPGLSMPTQQVTAQYGGKPLTSQQPLSPPGRQRQQAMGPPVRPRPGSAACVTPRGQLRPRGPQRPQSCPPFRQAAAQDLRSHALQPGPQQHLSGHILQQAAPERSPQQPVPAHGMQQALPAHSPQHLRAPQYTTEQMRAWQQQLRARQLHRPSAGSTLSAQQNGMHGLLPSQRPGSHVATQVGTRSPRLAL